MSEIHITSHNQSGGVTAHTVSGMPPPQHKPPPSRKPWWKKWGTWIVAAIGVVASVVAILEYLGIGPMERDMSDKPTINVTSYNQSGGVTAHTVNVAPIQRRMNPELGANIHQNLPRGSKVTVVAVMGDNEAFMFAQEIKGWMLENGYPDVQGVDQAVYSAPMFGQGIEKKGDSYDLIIGSQQR